MEAQREQDQSFIHLHAVNNRRDKVERTCGYGRDNGLLAQSVNFDEPVLPVINAERRI